MQRTFALLVGTMLLVFGVPGAMAAGDVGASGQCHDDGSTDGGTTGLGGSDADPRNGGDLFPDSGDDVGVSVIGVDLLTGVGTALALGNYAEGHLYDGESADNACDGGGWIEVHVFGTQVCYNGGVVTDCPTSY